MKLMKTRFVKDGIVKAENVVPAPVVNQVCEILWDALDRAGLCQDGNWIGMLPDGMADYSVQNEIMKRWLKPLVKRCGHFAQLQSEDIHKLAQEFAEQPLVTLTSRPQLLFTPPNATTWKIPNQNWHVDVPRLGDVGCPGVQAFVCIDEVVPGGGGTLAVAGSHRYLNDQGKVRSKKVKEGLRQVPWFKALFSQPQEIDFLNSTWMDDDRELQVIEMTGKPGDVYFMDLRVIHTLAPNVSARPRLMTAQRYYREDLDFYSGEDDILS